jgi:hypothetical protein
LNRKINNFYIKTLLISENNERKKVKKLIKVN